MCMTGNAQYIYIAEIVMKQTRRIAMATRLQIVMKKLKSTT